MIDRQQKKDKLKMPDIPEGVDGPNCCPKNNDVGGGGGGPGGAVARRAPLYELIWIRTLASQLKEPYRGTPSSLRSRARRLVRGCRVRAGGSRNGDHVSGLPRRD